LAFERARLAAELQAREINNPEDFLREGDEARVWAWLRWFDAENERRARKLGGGFLATQLKSDEWPPGAAANGGEPIVRRAGDEERAWAITKTPDLTVASAVKTLQALRRSLDRDPTPDEVREHAIAKARDYYGEEEGNLALRSSYSKAERAQLEAADDELRARRPDLFALKQVPA
jgi:hypothetical protein